MKIKDQLLINIIYLSFVGILIGVIGWAIEVEEFYLFLEISLVIFLLNGGFLVFKNGEFIKSKEFRFIGIGISLTLIGVMFKIMHWPYATYILTAGLGSFLLIYIIHIVMNNTYEGLKGAKLLFLATFLFGRIFKIMHWPFNKELTFVSIIILMAIVSIFIRNRNSIKKTAKDSETSFHGH